MQNILFKIGPVLGIILLFVGASVTPIISGSQQFEDKMDFLTLDLPVYSSTPDWISENPHYSTGAALADINRDSWLDLVVADGNDMEQGRLNVYYNNGKGVFPTTADWQSDDLAYNGHLDVADVNGDGWPDVAVSYLGTSSSIGPIARIYMNNVGTLSSSPDWTADITGNAFGVDFGDMNNDGCPDLAVATGWTYNSISYHNYVYLNTGTTLEYSASWESDDADILQGCLWLDADNDSWLDLACICYEEETKIYHNLGGMLETTASWQTSDSSNQDGIMLTHGDVNNDGISDLFATDNTQLGGSGLFKQYTGLDEGFFETTYSWNYFGGYGSAVALADVNGDKKLDLATGGWWDYTRIFINEGSGLPTSPTWNSGGTSVVEKIVFGNVGPEHCEHTITKYFNPDGDRKLFHLPHQPIQSILNVSLDGILLDSSQYTFSREHGWITINTAPIQSLDIVYNYSNSLDMAISNWDPEIGNYLYYNQLLHSPNAPTITGPTTGIEGQEHNFTVVAMDPDGDQIFYYIDWGDNTNSSWLGPYVSGEECNVTHHWTKQGHYEIKAKAKDICSAESGWSEPYIISIVDNIPPDAPAIDGPNRGKPRTTYEYGFTSVDTEEHDIAEYIVNWDDGTGEEIIFGPFVSGEEVKANHTWDEKGTYTIKAKAKDIYGLEGPEGTLTVNIPRVRAVNKPFLLRLFEQFPNLFPILRQLLRLG